MIIYEIWSTAGGAAEAEGLSVAERDFSPTLGTCVGHPTEGKRMKATLSAAQPRRLPAM